jgi:hypothetical protein
MYRSNLFATKQIATILEHVLFENINDRGVSCERKCEGKSHSLSSHAAGKESRSHDSGQRPFTHTKSFLVLHISVVFR